MKNKKAKISKKIASEGKIFNANREALIKFGIKVDDALKNEPKIVREILEDANLLKELNESGMDEKKRLKLFI